MDRESEPRRDLAQAPGRNEMGNERFTIISTEYTALPSGARLIKHRQEDRNQTIGAKSG